MPDPEVFSSTSHFDVFSSSACCSFVKFLFTRTLSMEVLVFCPFPVDFGCTLVELIKKNNNMSGGVGVFHFAALLKVVLVPPRVSPVGG